MSVRAHHLAALLFTAGAVLGTGVWLSARQPVALATCGSGSSVVVTAPAPPTGSTPPTLGGIFTLHAAASPSTATGMTFLASPTTTTTTNWQPLGEASQNSADWYLPWDTRNLPNGTYAVMAVAHYSNVATLDCASPFNPIKINNAATQSPMLLAVVSPSSWKGYVGQSATFSAGGVYTDQYGRKTTVSSPSTTWQTTIGNLAVTSGPSTVFAAGAAAGTGNVFANVSYSGLAAHAAAAITVMPTATASGSGTTSSPSPSPTATSDSTVSTETALATTPTIFRPPKPTNSDPVVPVHTLSCVQKQLGATRFDAISNGKSAPSTAERLKADTCFSGTLIIPSVLAPVAPSRLTDLDTTKDVVTVSGVKNQTVTNDQGKKITGLLVTGKGAPNSDVFIYIFSDPLVLRAQTDKSGSWSYVLEQPLTPGHHEVYAVAAKDASSFVRTSAVPVSIAAAAPGSSDGSLLIENRFSATQIGFAGLAALMVLAGLTLLVVLLRRRRKTPIPAAVAVATFAPAAATETPTLPDKPEGPSIGTPAE